MKLIILKNSIILLLILNYSTSTIIRNESPRELLGDDQLEDTLDSVIADTALTPKYAAKRVKVMRNEMRKIKQKCNKYLFVIKNYISFYQMKNNPEKYSEIEEMAKIEQPLAKPLNADNQKSLGTTPVNSPNANNQKPLGTTLARKLNWEQNNFDHSQLADYGDIGEHESNFAKIEDSEQDHKF